MMRHDDMDVGEVVYLLSGTIDIASKTVHLDHAPEGCDLRKYDGQRCYVVPANHHYYHALVTYERWREGFEKKISGC